MNGTLMSMNPAIVAVSALTAPMPAKLPSDTPPSATPLAADMPRLMQIMWRMT